MTLATYAGSPPAAQQRAQPAVFEGTFELELDGGRYLIVRSRGASTDGLVAPGAAEAAPAAAAGAGTALGGVRLEDVAPEVGLDFRHSAFHFRVSRDPVAMMGGGVCWLDYDADGWLDLFAVNSYSIELDLSRWREQGGLPRSALFRNAGGSVRRREPRIGSRRGAARQRLRRGGFQPRRPYGSLRAPAAGYDALLWNEGDGRFSEGAREAGIASYGWHAGAAVGDVNGDGLPDLFVAGYTDLNAPVPDASAGFPTTYAAVRDLLYLNEGPDEAGRSRFREVGLQAGIETARLDHGLGAVFTDVDGDGRLDLYVANDLDPNRLYANVPWPGGASADPAGLGFRLLERGRASGRGRRERRHGDRRRRLQRRRSPRPLRDQLAPAAARRLRELGAGRRRRAVRGRAPRPSRLPSIRRWPAGACRRPTSTSTATSISSSRTAPSPLPIWRPTPSRSRCSRICRLGAGWTDRGRQLGARRGGRPSVIGRGLAAADYDNDGDVDVAINSIGGPLVLLENDGARRRWLEVELGAFAPGTTGHGRAAGRA